MHRRSIPCLLAFAAIGCGGTQQQQTSVMAPTDPSMRTGGAAGGGAKVDPIFKPVLGLNSPLGSLKAISEKNPLAKALDGKVPTDSTAKLAKLDKGTLKLDDAYNYVVVAPDAPRVAVTEKPSAEKSEAVVPDKPAPDKPAPDKPAGGGDKPAPDAPALDKGITVPLPADAKANPDGSVWVVDAEMRRVFTLLGVKREADKPATVASATNADLVHPAADASVPPLALVARAEEATGETKHALRILVKGVGSEGAPAAGTTIRLKNTVSEKGVPPLAKSLVRALKKYGAVLEAGEGAPALSALTDPRWTKDDTKAIAVLHMSDFEVVAPPSKASNASKNKA